MSQTPEGKIKKEVKDALAQMGWFPFHVHSQSYYAHKGISDLITIKGGRVLFIEVKTPDGVLSDDQVEFGVSIKEHGGEYHIVRSVDDLLLLGVA